MGGDPPDKWNGQCNQTEENFACNGNNARVRDANGGIREDEDEATFLKLLQRNREFRLYISSYVITHMGEWFTYIASIALLEELLVASGSFSRTPISLLVVIRLIPNIILSPIGGILADGRDRRNSMIFLDVLGALTPLLFLLALQFQSIPLIYIVTFLQQMISGLYEPCRSAIIPLMVPEEDYLKKATTLAGLAWSIFAAIGSSIGGLVLTMLGFKACFVLDSLTYMASAYLMYLVGGTWNVTENDNSDGSRVFRSLLDQIRGMTIDGLRYIRASFFGPLILLKATAGVVYGAADVLNVSFSEPNGINDKNSPARLGILFACMGVGCTIGPLISDRLTNMKHPISLQRACIAAQAFEALGFFGMAFVDHFWPLCAFTLVRTGGASTNWIDSSILLQKFSSDEMMGRVLAADFSLALLAEATSAYVAGALQDKMNLDAHQVALVMACGGFFCTFLWIVYHSSGGGAGDAPLHHCDPRHTTQTETSPLLSGNHNTNPSQKNDCMPSFQKSKQTTIKDEQNNNKTSISRGQVPVFYVQKKNAKRVKNVLEELSLIDKHYRLTAAAGQTATKDSLAIPVHPNAFKDVQVKENASKYDWSQLVVGTGMQQCLYSTTVLGNPNKHRMTLTAKNWSPLKESLLKTVQACFPGLPAETQNKWKEHIQKLNASFCPLAVEFLGDDKNLVLPNTALGPVGLRDFLETDLGLALSAGGSTSVESIMATLWNEVVRTYGCPRILRKGGVDPNSRIRHTGYQLLWPTDRPRSQNQPRGPHRPSWITVTEQGIRQSFDVTHVMFSRGNISEKIRFGRKLVQENDIVLDLYAGIGYYTLPALIQGKAAHVIACEWNYKALEALRYNIRDNHVESKVTVIPGDCRELVLPSTIRNLRINRVSLGLLPSSEGGWNVAVKAILGRLVAEEERHLPGRIQQSNVSGGWLHVHGNVPAREQTKWAHWLCYRLYHFVQQEQQDPVEADWVVVCHHVEKVKSFAPTVYHYVADVFMGPRHQAREIAHPQRVQKNWVYSKTMDDDCHNHCFWIDPTCDKLKACAQEPPAPSCALSADGVLHQEWMRSKKA